MHTSLLSSALLLFAAQAPQGAVGPTYRFADYDRDGLADIYAVRPGSQDRLFKNLGDGSFVDVSDSLGLAAITGSRMALWQDFDADGWLDLYVCAASGRSRLLRNESGASFIDVTVASGLAHRDGPELFAEWVDFDADGWSDLHIVTEQGDRLFRNLSGRFTLVDLGASARTETGVSMRELDLEASAAPVSAPVTIAPAGAGLSPSSNLSSSLTACTHSVQDLATSGCIDASTVPTIGRLFPLTSNLNVSANGNVGVGTTSPGVKLDVSGDLRASGQLVSSAITGAPLIVSSTTKVTNLNADRLDGLDSSAFTQLGNSIDGSEITDATITSADLAGNSITSTKIAASAITSALIADGTITAADVAADALTAANIATGAVTSSELLDGGVSAADIAPGAVTSTAILDGTIAAADIAASAITSASIADGAIVGVDIANSSIDSSKFITPMTGPTTLSVPASAYASKVSNTGAIGIRDGLRVDVASGSAYGVWSMNNAVTASAYAVRAQSASPTARALYGEATNSGATVAYGVYGLCHNASAFGVYSEGDFGGTGAKYFIQPHPSDPSKQINFACLEGNESGTYFRGSTLLSGGVAVVEVPESFRLVTEPGSVTATATAVGAPALVWIESQTLDRIVVRANLDVTVNYVVNGTRRGFRGLETIRDNTSFVPQYKGLPFGLQYRPEYRQLLVQSGVLNADFTPNEVTAQRLGWKLDDPWDDEHAEPSVRALIEAGLVVAPPGWIPPSERAALDGAQQR